MTHKEYTEAIEKQKTLINRLFKSRDERSRRIDEITKERYSNLIGTFFKADDTLKYAQKGAYYHIVDVKTITNYADGCDVAMDIIVRSYGRTEMLCKDGWKAYGVHFTESSFRFETTDDITEILSPMMVTKEEAMENMMEMEREMEENYLSI